MRAQAGVGSGGSGGGGSDGSGGGGDGGSGDDDKTRCAPVTHSAGSLQLMLLKCAVVQRAVGKPLPAPWSHWPHWLLPSRLHPRALQKLLTMADGLA